MNVPQRRVLGRLPRPPGTGSTGRLGLLPDDLATQVEADVAEETGDVMIEWQLRLPAQVGHVHRYPAPCLEDSIGLTQHSVQQFEVLGE